MLRRLSTKSDGLRWAVGTALVVVPVTALAVAGTHPLLSVGGRQQRGQYLVTAMGCASCHTPKTMGPHGPRADGTRFLAGHPEALDLGPPPRLDAGGWVAVSSWDTTAWSGPWGVSYAANITPDENTAIGSWSEETFVRALRTGRHMGVSRPILPPMPWSAFRNLTDEDLRSIYAYLRTVPPVHNRVPEPVPAQRAPRRCRGPRCAAS
jgi:mono/diheme cytochrome c family protein